MKKLLAILALIAFFVVGAVGCGLVDSLDSQTTEQTQPRTDPPQGGDNPPPPPECPPGCP